MLDLMAANGGELPLYLHVVKRVLRDLRLEQQRDGSSFSYTEFRTRMDREDLTSSQQGPFQQRLDMLESFMPRTKARGKKENNKPDTGRGNDWKPKVRCSTVDGAKT
jgi:hypothetical protein